MKQISIILPTYKPGDYIYECILSVCNQTIDKELIELIIILNGCNEPYYSELQNYCKNLSLKPTIHIIQTDTPGVSNARNIGIERAKGEYLCFLDDDDLFSPSFLEELLAVSSPQCVGLSNVHSFVYDSLENSEKFFLTKLFKRNKVLKRTLYNFRSYFSVAWAKLIHKDLLKNAKFDNRFANCEDVLFMTGVCLNFSQFNFTSESAIYYVRIRPGSASRRKFFLCPLLSLLIKQEWEYLKILSRNRDANKVLFLISRMVATLISVCHMWYSSIRQPKNN